MEDPRMGDKPAPSKFTRFKQFVKDNDVAVFAGAGCFIGASLVIAYPKFFMEMPPGYNPHQPVPGLSLTEDQIFYEVASGVAVGEFLKKRKLLKEFKKFLENDWEAVNVAADSGDRAAIQAAVERLNPGTLVTTLSELPLPA